MAVSFIFASIPLMLFDPSQNHTWECSDVCFCIALTTSPSGFGDGIRYFGSFFFLYWFTVRSIMKENEIIFGALFNFFDSAKSRYNLRIRRKFTYTEDYFHCTWYRWRKEGWCAFCLFWDLPANDAMFVFACCNALMVEVQIVNQSSDLWTLYKLYWETLLR